MKTNNTPKTAENATGGSRARTPENDQEQVSVSKEVLADGAEKTTVVHPPRKLKAPGEIKAAYESGNFDLDQLTENVDAGLRAMKPVISTHTKGSGKERETWQEVTYVPDYDTRLRWQDHLTNTVEGMPIKRQEIVSRKLTTKEDLMAQAAKSPAFARSLLRTLKEVIEYSEKGGAKKVPPNTGSH